MKKSIIETKLIELHNSIELLVDNLLDASQTISNGDEDYRITMLLFMRTIREVCDIMLEKYECD